MKKLFVLASFICLSFAASSQELGLRFGDVLGNNVAIDGVFRTGKNRIHADVSFGDGVGIEVLWDLIYKPLGGEAFNWYLGVGPSVLIGDDPFLLGASGELGLEYRFKGAPIALGLDWRPTLVIVENTDFRAGGFGLNVRYVFGSNR
jgi:hypothetical protein